MALKYLLVWSHRLGTVLLFKPLHSASKKKKKPAPNDKWRPEAPPERGTTDITREFDLRVALRTQRYYWLSFGDLSTSGDVLSTMQIMSEAPGNFISVS